MSNKLEVTLSFKPIMDGLDRFVAGLNSRMEKVKAFNMRIENGAKATNQLLAQAGTVLGLQQLKSYVGQASEAERVQKQLTAAMRKQGVYSGEYLGQLNSMAEALERVTNFQGEQITAVQRQLISYKVARKDIVGLTEDVLDLAQALGIGPEQAAVLLGKTLRGEQEELGRYGIQIDGTKNRVVALHEAVQRFAGGQARSGVAFPQLHQASVVLDQLKKDLGKAIAEGIGPFVSGFVNGMSTVAAWAGRALNLVRDFLPASENLRPLGELLGKATIAALAFLAPLLAIRALMVGLPAVINPARMAYVFLFGVDILDAVRDIQSFSKALGMIETLKVANWGQRFAAFGAVVSAAFAGWQIGSFLNELEIGGMKISDWTARTINYFLGWADKVGGAFATAWVLVKFNFFSKLTEGRMQILEFVDFVTEKLNKVLPSKWQLPVDSIKAAIAEYKKELGSLDTEKSAALAAIEARLQQQAALRSGVGDDLAAKGRAGVAKPGAPDAGNGTPTDTTRMWTQADIDKARALRAELELKRAIFDLDTAILEAQQDGNQELLNKLMRQRGQLQALNDLGTEAYDIIQARLDIEEETRIKQKQRQDQERAHAVQMADLDQKLALVQANRFLTAEQKGQKSVEILRQQNALIAQRIALLEEEKRAGVTDERRSTIDQTVDQLRSTAASNVGEIASQEPLSFMQTQLQAVIGFVSQIGSVAQQVAGVFSNVMGAAVNGISSSIMGLIKRTMTWRDALYNIASSVIEAVISSFANMAAQWIVKQIVMAVAGKAIQAASLAAMLPMALATTAMWAPAATAASIATFGTAAVTGAAMAHAAILSSVAGFALGGFPAGGEQLIRINEQGQEFVVSNPAVRKFGSTFLEDLNNGVLNLGALPGNVAAGMATPDYGAGGAGGGAGSFDPAAMIDAIAKKINFTANVIPDERAAKRIDRRSQAAGDIIAIVRQNRAAIFKSGV